MYVRGTPLDALNHYYPKYGLLMEHDYHVPDVFPDVTKFLGDSFSLKRLYKILRGASPVIAYAFDDNIRGWHEHPDPDARFFTKAFFMNRLQVQDVILHALKHQHAATFLTGGHDLALYGVDLDSQGNALSYYIKDSYDSYFYRADPSMFQENVIEIATLGGLEYTPL